MGYSTAEIKILLRLDNHLGPETERDKTARDNLCMEINALVKSNPDYDRIVMDVWGDQ